LILQITKGEKVELKDAILGRRSIRRFTDKEIPREVLEEILETGIWAPTASNSQVWIFIAVTDPAMLKKIRTVSPGMFWTAKAVICIGFDKKKAEQYFGSGNYRLPHYDCGMAAQNMMLRAYDLGLGSCVMASFDDQAVGNLLSVPEHIKIELLLMLGYYTQTPKVPARNENVIHFEKFKQR